MEDLHRRSFLTLFGGAAAAWPLGAGAQQRPVPVIGFLHPGSALANGFVVTAFLAGLGELGYADGRNIRIEYRWAENNNERLAEMAAELARRHVSLIATPASAAAALAAKAATTAIPIVFEFAVDPVEIGIVSSLNRPGGNVTGVVSMNAELGAKRLGILHELLPRATQIGALVNPGNPNAERLSNDMQSAASGLGLRLQELHAGTVSEIEAAFPEFAQNRAQGLLIGPDPLFASRRVELALLAARHALPAIFADRLFAEAGGLMSYSSNITELYRQTGVYAGRVLQGEKPSEIPILRPTKFEFIINLQAARILNLGVPPTLLAIADEVIE